MPTYKTETDQLYCFNIYIEVFRVNIRLVWCEDKVRIQHFMQCQDDNHQAYDLIPAGTMGCVFSTTTEGLTIPVICFPWKWRNEPRQIATIAHESLHAVYNIAKQRDFAQPLSDHKNEELYCYLLDFILEKCLDALNDQDQYRFQFNNEQSEPEPEAAPSSPSDQGSRGGDSLPLAPEE